MRSPQLACQLLLILRRVKKSHSWPIEYLGQHRIIPALRLKHRSGGSPRQEPPQAAVALRSASLRLGVRHGICVAKMLDNTQSIICAFGLAAAAPRSPYRHLELCGIALGATIGRPSAYRSNAFSGTVCLQGKQVRASNARPYKSFLTVCILREDIRFHLQLEHWCAA